MARLRTYGRITYKKESTHISLYPSPPPNFPSKEAFERVTCTTVALGKEEQRDRSRKTKITKHFLKTYA